MQAQAVMLYFLNEEDAERFDLNNRTPEDFFTQLRPQTTAHFISQNDLQNDEHSWLAQEGYDHEKGYELVFDDGDTEDVRQEILKGLLRNDYALCAWQKRFLFVPHPLRIHHMVEMDVMHSVLRLSSFEVKRVQTAFDCFTSTY